MFSSALDVNCVVEHFICGQLDAERIKRPRSKVQGQGSNWQKRLTFLTIQKPHLPPNPTGPPKKSMEARSHRKFWGIRGLACSLSPSSSLLKWQLLKISDHLLGTARPRPTWLAFYSPLRFLPFFTLLVLPKYHIFLFITFPFPRDCKLHKVRALCSPRFPLVLESCLSYCRHCINICWMKEHVTKVSSIPRSTFLLSSNCLCLVISF